MGWCLSVCAQMLRGVESSYTQLYLSLISINEVDHAFTRQQKEEVVEILHVGMSYAWLKLRRYNELGREVDNGTFGIVVRVKLHLLGFLGVYVSEMW